MAEIDRGKVIRPLQVKLDEVKADGLDVMLCSTEIIENVITLLKEQEAVTYKVVKAGEKSYPFYDLVCTGCGNKTGMRMDWKYCPGCGRVVKWNADRNGNTVPTDSHTRFDMDTKVN